MNNAGTGTSNLCIRQALLSSKPCIQGAPPHAIEGWRLRERQSTSAASGHERRFCCVCVRSALPSRATAEQTLLEVSKVPSVDIAMSSLQQFVLTPHLKPSR